MRIFSRKRSYQCDACDWQGMLEPVDAEDAAPCPECGEILYPLSWTETWGVALTLIATAVALVYMVARATS